MGNQKFHFVCLSCRRSIKRAEKIEWTGDWNNRVPHTRAIACAECGGEMAFVGKYFAAPKRRDDVGWKKLAWMIEKGWSADGWRVNAWPVSPAMNLNQVRESLRTNQIARVARLQREKERESFDVAKRHARNLRMAGKRAALELKKQRKYQDAVLARVQSER